MALQRAKLADITTLGTSAAAVIENTNGTDKILVTGVSLHNTNTSNEVVELYYVPDNGSGGIGTAAATNRIEKVVLVADETLHIEFPFGFMLTDEGDAIQGKTTTSAKVTIVPHGDKIT